MLIREGSLPKEFDLGHFFKEFSLSNSEHHVKNPSRLFLSCL